MTIDTRVVRIAPDGALAIEPRALRDPGPHEIVVRVAAAGLNRADVLQRRGLYPAPPGVLPDVPGLEYAGTVVARGTGAVMWPEGARVMGIVAGGAMAEHVIVHEREVMRVPTGMSLEDAAAIPEAFLTAYDALSREAQLQPGQHALVHSVASGVGTAAVQLIRWMGARSIGTSRTADKLGRCEALGMDVGVLVPKEGEPAFAADVLRASDGRGAHAVLDTVGARYLGENLRSVAPQGTIVVIGLLGGMSAELPLALLLGKRARIAGTTLRARPIEEKAALARACDERLVGAFERGTLRPVRSETLPMADVAEAHARMESNDTFGKIVLAW